MRVKSQTSRAANRRAKNETAITAAKSPRDRLRYALEWVASEARLLDGPGTDELIHHIAGVARTLNERSRA